jgi:hypothetical protein
MTDMPKQVFDALKVILDEFGDCDLPERLKYYAGEYPDLDNPGEAFELGRQPLRAFNLVRAWSIIPAITEDDIRDSFEESDSDWANIFVTSVTARDGEESHD